MNIRGFVLCFVSVISVTMTYAQDGRIMVVKDSLITALQKFRAEYAMNPTPVRPVVTTTVVEEKVVDKKTGKRVRVKGFRVQIFSGVNRADAVATQNAFLRRYANVGAYLTYDEPNFRVKVGDFRTRNEANDFISKIRTQYRNAFVFVEDVWTWQ